LAVQPAVLLIGVFFPVLEGTAGLIALLCLSLKSVLIVMATLLLISSGGIRSVAAALRSLRVPKVFVLQLLLTYRYVSVLLGEVYRVSLNHSLRAPGQRGIQVKAWGSLAGHMLVRAFDRAGRVYQAMRLRGFDGEYITGRELRIGFSDALWLVICAALFLSARLYNIPRLLEGMLFGRG